jgi:cytochrome c oxidase subunit 3
MASDQSIPVHERRLPVGSVGRHASGWWGMWTLIATEAALFGYLIFSYLYLYSQYTGTWLPDGRPKLGTAGINTVVLLSSSVFVWLCERLVKRRRFPLAVASMCVGILLGILFVALQMKEYREHHFGPSTHLYGSLYFTITGFHMLHAIVGLCVLIFLLAGTGLHYFDEQRHSALTIGGMYWHFVDVVWLFIFSTLYLSPYLL